METAKGLPGQVGLIVERGGRKAQVVNVSDITWLGEDGYIRRNIRVMMQEVGTGKIVVATVLEESWKIESMQQV